MSLGGEKNDKFCIKLVDETIERSRRIVKESLEMSRSNLGALRGVVKEEVKTDDDQEVQAGALQIGRGLLMEMKEREKARREEISRLEALVEQFGDVGYSKSQSTLDEKNKKINELTKAINTHQLHIENQEIAQKIEEMKISNGLKKIVSDEKRINKAMEDEYDMVYAAREQTLQEVAKIREIMRICASENKKKIIELSKELELKTRESQRLVGEMKEDFPGIKSSITLKSFDMDSVANKSKRSRRYSNPELENEFFLYNQKISSLQAKLQKVKEKYRNLKKLYMKSQKALADKLSTQTLHKNNTGLKRRSSLVSSDKVKF